LLSPFGCVTVPGGWGTINDAHCGNLGATSEMSERPSRFIRPELNDDTPITLQEACDLYFRGIITPAALRAEHGRGMLTIFRVGRQDFTTLRFVRTMQENKCRAQDPAPASGSTRPAKRTPSSTGESQSALDAARASFKRRKISLRRRDPN
jgi:hypothetical protein